MTGQRTVKGGGVNSDMGENSDWTGNSDGGGVNSDMGENSDMGGNSDT